MHFPRPHQAAVTAPRPAARAALVLLVTAGLFAPAAFAQMAEPPAAAATPADMANEARPAQPASASTADPREDAVSAPEAGAAVSDAAPFATGDVAPTAPGQAVDDSPGAASQSEATGPAAPASQGAAADRAAVPLQDAASPDAGQPVVSDAAPYVDSSAAVDARSDAERDFDALYGPYDPVADPTLPPPAQVRGAYDPWEPLNRRVHRFNNVVDRNVARPLARTYVKVVPRPLRLGVGNFFNNLGQPVSALNALLQGKPKQAAQSLGRFALNTTLGIGGLFDPASDAKLPNKSEDFGQTLGVWGWQRSRYVELPLFGPRTLRDVFGMVGDGPLSPLRQVDADKIRVPIQGMQLVDIRAQLLSTDSLREGAEDDYALVRDAWSQRRDYQIFGDRTLEGDDSLPDYLREENNPTVPVDAMPMMPTDGS